MDDAALVEVVEGSQNIFQDQSANNFGESREEEILDGLLAAAEAVEREDDVDVQVLHEHCVDFDNIFMAECQNSFNFLANGFELLVAVVVSRDSLQGDILGRRLVQGQENTFAESRANLVIGKHLRSSSETMNRSKLQTSLPDFCTFPCDATQRKMTYFCFGFSERFY